MRSAIAVARIERPHVIPAPYAASVQHQRPEGAVSAVACGTRARRRQSQAAGGQVQHPQARQLAQHSADGRPVREQVAREVALYQRRRGRRKLPRLTLVYRVTMCKLPLHLLGLTTRPLAATQVPQGKVQRTSTCGCAGGSICNLRRCHANLCHLPR